MKAEPFRWQSLSEAEFDQAAARVAARAGPDFRLAPRCPPRSHPFPELEDQRVGARWVYLPGGGYEMGLSRAEEKTARELFPDFPFTLEEMRPVHAEWIGSFLVTQRPVSIASARMLLGSSSAAGNPFDFEGTETEIPAWCTRNEAEEVVRRAGGQLPTEAQWEYFCRAGSRALFFFGNEEPQTEADLDAFAAPSPRKWRPNPFGLMGLFVGEWCRDNFRPAYDSEPLPDVWTVRGGASLFWPLSGDKLSLCASARRMPSSDTFDGRCGLRVVRELQD